MKIWSCCFFPQDFYEGLGSPPSKQRKKYIDIKKQTKTPVGCALTWTGTWNKYHLPPDPSRVFAGVSWHTLLQASHFSNYPGDLLDSGVRKKTLLNIRRKTLKILGSVHHSPCRVPKHAPPSFQAPTTPKGLIDFASMLQHMAAISLGSTSTHMPFSTSPVLGKSLQTQEMSRLFREKSLSFFVDLEETWCFQLQWT